MSTEAFQEGPDAIKINPDILKETTQEDSPTSPAQYQLEQQFQQLEPEEAQEPTISLAEEESQKVNKEEEELATEEHEQKAPAVETPQPIKTALYENKPLPKPPLLPEDKELEIAKAFLSASNSSTNLYDHLTQVVLRILQSRPQNSLELFEHISSETKRNTFPTPSNPFRSIKQTIPGVERCELIVANLEKSIDESTCQVPDLLELSRLYCWAGIDLAEDAYVLHLSLKRLGKEKGLKSVRWWGRIDGRESDYWIAEGELAVADENGGKEVERVEGWAEYDAIVKEANDAFEDPNVPQSKFRKNKPVPKEAGVGVNKYVYYCCGFVGDEWVRLPDIVPGQISAARFMRRGLTGKLDTIIRTYPQFNGTEAHYLRAQIARITASTVVSPVGYYVFDSEEEEAETQSIVVNNEYEATNSLALTELSQWNHHIPYILPQGRTTWLDPNFEEKEEGEEEDGEEEVKAAEPETGPLLLSTIDKDEGVAGLPAWTVRVVAELENHSPVVLKSVKWPGAFVVAHAAVFSCVYVGNGLPELGRAYKPLDLPPVLTEFVSEALVEQVDSTVEEEKEYQKTNGKEKEEEGEEEEEE